MCRGPLVLVAVGSNIATTDCSRGDRVRSALADLRRLAAAGFQASSLWRSAAVGGPDDAADYVNAVAAFRVAPTVHPWSMLRALQRLERRAGRPTRRTRNTPRTLDLDLLTFGDWHRDSVLLSVPHPQALARHFVLQPASEVAPGLLWPGTERTVSEWLAALPPAGDDLRRLNAADESL
ncbi:MAG: 2-amino-4-hydroxy-6-hydroxymethyldihydropteridine diphosphokinase [Pseudomonadota bacterium]